MHGGNVCLSLVYIFCPFPLILNYDQFVSELLTNFVGERMHAWIIDCESFDALKFKTRELSKKLKSRNTFRVHVVVIYTKDGKRQVWPASWSTLLFAATSFEILGGAHGCSRWPILLISWKITSEKTFFEFSSVRFTKNELVKENIFYH